MEVGARTGQGFRWRNVLVKLSAIVVFCVGLVSARERERERAELRRRRR